MSIEVFCDECGEELEVTYIDEDDDKFYQVCYCHVFVKPCKCQPGEEEK